MESKADAKLLPNGNSVRSKILSPRMAFIAGFIFSAVVFTILWKKKIASTSGSNDTTQTELDE